LASISPNVHGKPRSNQQVCRRLHMRRSRQSPPAPAHNGASPSDSFQPPDGPPEQIMVAGRGSTVAPICLVWAPLSCSSCLCPRRTRYSIIMTSVRGIWAFFLNSAPMGRADIPSGQPRSRAGAGEPKGAVSEQKLVGKFMGGAQARLEEGPGRSGSLSERKSALGLGSKTCIRGAKLNKIWGVPKIASAQTPEMCRHNPAHRAISVGVNWPRRGKPC
uniref:Uncharacterized protein n=1 Tax=Podarcis muralis TaxID=64176 RepID=A0A670J8X8_PODMU